MSIRIIFKHMDSSPALEAYAREGIEGCIRKYISKDFSAMVTFEVNNAHIVKLHVHVDDKMQVLVQEKHSNMYAALDLAMKKLDFQLARIHKRCVNHNQKGKSLRDLEFVQPGTYEDMTPIDASEVIAAERKAHRPAVDLSYALH